MQLETIGELLRAHLNPWTVIFGGLLLILVLFATLAAKDLRWSVYIFLLAIAFTGSRYPVIHMFCYILRWLILALITLRVLSGRSRARISTVSVLFFLWAAVAMVSAFQAPTLTRGIAFGIIYFLCFFVFFLLLPGEIVSEDDIHKWFKIFIFMGWTFALLSFGVFILNPRGYSTNSGRLMAMFANPMKLSRILVFAATIFLWNGVRTIGHRSKQILYYIAVLFCAYLIFLTGSRGAWGAFAIVLAVFALHYRGKMSILIIPALVIAGLYVVPRVLRVAPKPFVRRATTLETPHRPMLRELAMERFKERPFQGWGLGSVSDVRADVCPRFVSFHNSYLNYLVEFGLFGFLIAMTVLIWTYIRVLRLALFWARNEYIRDVSWYIIANLTYLFAWDYFNGAFTHPAYIHFYWLFILIVLTDCLVRINQQLAYEQALEYSSGIYPAYDEGTIAQV
jgi:O-antigen ligase